MSWGWLEDAAQRLGDLIDGVRVTGRVGGGGSPALSIHVDPRKLVPREYLVLAFALGLILGAILRGGR